MLPPITARRPEHVIVAGDVLGRLGSRAKAVASISVAGVEIVEPVATAQVLRAQYASAHTSRVVAWVLNTATKIVHHANNAVDWAASKIGIKRQVRFPLTSMHRQQVLDATQIVARLRNGDEVKADVEIARRSASMHQQLIGVSAISTAFIPIPGGGVPGVLLSTLIAGASAAVFACRGDWAISRTSLATAARNLLLLPVDCIPLPGVPSAALAATGGASVAAYNTTRNGNELGHIDFFVHQLEQAIDALPPRVDDQVIAKQVRRQA